MKKFINYALAAFVGALAFTGCSCNNENKIDNVDDVNATEEAQTEEVPEAETSAAQQFITLINETNADLDKATTAEQFNAVVNDYLAKKAAITDAYGLEWSAMELQQINPVENTLLQKVTAKAGQLGVAVPTIKDIPVAIEAESTDESGLDPAQAAAVNEVDAQINEVLQ